MSRIVTVVQARMGSTRLPGKVMLDLVGQPLLLRMIERVQAAQKVETIVVATTVEASDDPIEALCIQNGLRCYRGSVEDLLDRHYQAGRLWNADAVAKIPSDCPLIDPAVIDRVFEYFLQNDYDYVSNLHPATYPDGNDVEVMKMSALEVAWKEARRPFEREHTTPFLWENPNRFSIGNVRWETGLDYSMTHRWTIDYPEDYAFIRAVYEELYPKNPRFTLQDILDLTERRPDIFALNCRYAGVNWYRHHLHELKTITADQTRHV
ncbi:MAG: glycosyltransferase family protein [Saprospiraceae bacterium]|nr:glycosyltransferase family protein [Saprospiraceae bacterium]MDW8485180.1 glycosyltransferase family protein [Saprospiraceae bacterium]